MSNGIIGGIQKRQQFEVESGIVKCEGELNQIINRVKTQGAPIEDIKAFLKVHIQTTPNAIPVLCSLIAAQFPDHKELTLVYLQEQTIFSYQNRIQSGEKEAEKLLDLYLKRIGRKEDHTTLQQVEEQ